MNVFDAYEGYIQRCLDQDLEPMNFPDWAEQWDEDAFDNDRQENL